MSCNILQNLTSPPSLKLNVAFLKENMVRILNSFSSIISAHTWMTGMVSKHFLPDCLVLDVSVCDYLCSRTPSCNLPK